MTGRTGKRRFLGLLWSLILTCSLITGMSMSAWAQKANDEPDTVCYSGGCR